MKDIFNPHFAQFKGQLHIHTKNSDGLFSQEESFKAYKNLGFDFLAFTEHRMVTPGEMREGVLILSGIELDMAFMNGPRAAYHVIGIDLDENKFFGIRHDCDDPQILIDTIIKADGIAIVAHPSWSLLSPEELYKLKNYTAIEIMNGMSEVWHARGDSSTQIDKLMSLGKPSKTVATDDTHYYSYDIGKSYIKVICEELTRESIVNAIKSGSMYSTMGPEFKRIYIENGKLHVECSEVEKIMFISDSFYTDDENRRMYFDENGITKAYYLPFALDTYIRVEITDKFGKKAWSNYISAKEIKED